MSDAAPPPAAAPPPLRAFLDLYRAGRFWDSHEALEGAWREGGSDFYQGLILYASAWVHWERGNAHGVAAQLGKALQRLDNYPSDYLGLDVQAVRRHCRACLTDVGSGRPGWRERIGPLPLELDPERLGGGEPEVDGGGQGGAQNG